MQLYLAGLLIGCESTPPLDSPSPEDEEITCRGEYVTTNENGEVTNIGSRALDSLGQPIQEEATNLSTDRTSRTSWFYDEDLLLETRQDPDGDGFTDEVVVYGYDDEGRVIQRFDFVQEIRFIYDRDEHLVEELTFDTTGQLVYTRQQSWKDGRVTSAVTSNADGLITSISEFVYNEPSPSLDHEERVSYIESASEMVWSRSFDEAGRLLEEEAAVEGDTLQELRQTWDSDGRLVESQVRRIWWDVWSSTTHVWVYGSDGLLVDEQIMLDSDDDGTEDQVYISQWAWSCV